MESNVEFLKDNLLCEIAQFCQQQNISDEEEAGNVLELTSKGRIHSQQGNHSQYSYSKCSWSQGNYTDRLSFE